MSAEDLRNHQTLNPQQVHELKTILCNLRRGLAQDEGIDRSDSVFDMNTINALVAKLPTTVVQLRDYRIQGLIRETKVRW